MRWVKTPNWIQYLFPNLVWKIPETQKIIYFTFDDGPTPEVTPLVLDLLFQYDAKATFFCTGWKAEKYPGLVESIRKAGHVVGNHGYEHKDGFFTKASVYLMNAENGANVTMSNLFRPPYGRITPYQIKRLGSKYKIIQWSIMSMDFSKKCSIADCYKNVVAHLFPGDIVLFHDTLQASDCLLPVLPRLLSYFQGIGYEFRALDNL